MAHLTAFESNIFLATTQEGAISWYMPIANSYES